MSASEVLRLASEKLRAGLVAMDREVALALADLLWQVYVMPQVAVMPSVREYALAVARAILREEGPDSTSPEPGPAKDGTE